MFSGENIYNGRRPITYKLIQIINHKKRANWDIYDNFKFKEPFGFHGL